MLIITISLRHYRKFGPVFELTPIGDRSQSRHCRDWDAGLNVDLAGFVARWVLERTAAENEGHPGIIDREDLEAGYVMQL